MHEAGLPSGLEQFIKNRIDSVELLEVLIHLQKNLNTPVSAESLSKTLYSSALSIVMRLDKLVSLGLAATIPDSESMYQYAPVNQKDDQMVRKLAVAYAERPVAVIAAIMSRPTKNVQAFSDAFLIRNGDDNS